MLASGQDQKHPVPPERWDSSIGYEPGANELWKVPTNIGGFITDFEYDWKKHKVPPKQIATADPLQFMLLDAADQALQDAGYSKEKPFDRLRTGVVVGTIFCGGDFGEQLQMGLGLPQFRKHLANGLRKRGVPEDAIDRIADEYQKILLKRMPALVDETGSFTASTMSSRITKTFDLMGGATAVDSGDASSFAALNACMDLLQTGDCDMMICAAGHRAMGFGSYELMARNGILTFTSPKGPFDQGADGCVPGEGVGVLLLKRLSDAERDGNRIHAIIRGIGVARSESLEEGLKIAAERSYAEAGLSQSQISIVETASTGIPQKDAAELAAVVKTFGSEPRDAPLQMGAVAGQFGHTGGASGALELLKAMSELNHAEMPPNVVGDSLRPEIASHEQTLALSRTAAKLPGLNEDGRLYAGINSFSQCQVAYHLIIEGAVKVPKSPAPPIKPIRSTIKPVVSTNGTWRIVRIGTANEPELWNAAAEAIDQAAKLYTEADQSAFQASHRNRLAIVAESADDLAAKLDLFLKQGKQPAAKTILEGKGIFWNEVLAAPPRIAFAFPGQGSQYTGMLKSLVEDFPPARETCRELDEVLAKLRLPSFAELAWQEENPLDSDVWRTQLSLLVANTLAYSAVRELGLKPDCVFGHSFGELAALVAAGAWSFEEAVLATRARCESIDNCTQNPGVLVSTSAPADVIETLCRQISDLAISHQNAPDQTVAGGTEDAVSRLADAVIQRGFQAKILDVPAAFHTWLMEPVKKPFGAALEQIAISPPKVPVLSSVTNRYVADPWDIRENLVIQMTKPVEYVALAERLVADGVNLIVEVGPRQVLTGLHNRIFPNGELVTVGCDHPKRSGVQQLLAARACVEVTGALDPQRQSSVLRIARATEASPAQTPTEDAVTTVSPVVEEHHGLHLLRLSGSPYEMGYQHGQAQKAEIRAILRRYADLAGSRWDRLWDMETLVAQADAFFGPTDMEEMRGIAKGADVTLGSVISHNLRLYLDAGAGGLHFAVTARLNQNHGLLHAANEELRLGLGVRDCLDRIIQVRKPAAGLASITFGVAGQVGSLNGINARGLAISTAALLDIPKDEPSPVGRLPIVIVKAALEQAEDIEAAVAIIRQVPKAGAFSLCLSHSPSDRVCYVEFDGQELKVLPTAPAVISANHRLMRTFASEIPAASLHRLNRLRDLLGGDPPRDVTSERAQKVLRDHFDPSRGREVPASNINTLRRVDNQISIIFEPGRGNLWVTAGPKSNGHQNEFCELKLSELLPELAANSPQSAEAQNPSNQDRPPSFASTISREELLGSYRQAEQAQGNQQTVCQRFALRMVETEPLPAKETPQITGGVVIVGENPISVAIREKLQSRNVPVTILSANESIENLLAKLASVWQTTPSPHLILATACDAEAVTNLDDPAWDQRRQRGVMLPYQACQKWYQLMLSNDLFAEGSLLAVTRLGGDFGFSGEVQNVESGALAGLVKGVAMELKLARHVQSFRAKIVDAAASMSPQDIADAALAEWLSDDAELEVGYLGTRRFVVRPEAVSLEANSRDLPQGGVFVITGGARGVTAEVARELGLWAGAKLHLIGSSPEPVVPAGYHQFSAADLKDYKAAVMKEALAAGQKPIDVWAKFEKAVEIDRNLKAFADAGLDVTYHSSDIADRDALEKLLAEIRQTSGPITGIVHGAGFERAASFEKKKLELVDATIRAKVDGAANLMALTRNDPLRFFVTFGSVSGRFGGVGQTDYCLANEMLAKLGAWYRKHRPDCPLTTFHWHAWDDVGMAVRPESKHIAKLHNISFMPAREGTEHLLREITAGLPEREIAITELGYCRDKYSNTANLLSSPTAHTSADAFGPAAFPMVDSIAEQEPGRRVGRRSGFRSGQRHLSSSSTATKNAR